MNANKNLTLSLATHWNFSPVLKCRFSLWNSSPKKPKIQASLPPFWTVLSSQTAWSWRHSVRKIKSKWLPKSLLTTTLGYGCSGAVHFQAKSAPNLELDSRKVEKWIISWKKIQFADFALWRLLSHLQVFLLSATFELDGMTSNTTWLPSTEGNVEFWTCFETKFFRIVGPSI